MTDMEFTTYSEEHLSALVTFWNREFRGKRNFFPISAEIFKQRVVEKRNALERFDPSGLILAIGSGGQVAGMIHVGVNSEEFCRTCVPNWPGGSRGYVAIIAVAESLRRRGIGAELWRRAMRRLEGCREIVIDGQCLNPFYGNSEGPFTPLWGTTEGISVEWDNIALRTFFERRGHKPRYKGLSLVLDLAVPESTRPLDARKDSESNRADGRARLAFVISYDRYPIIGQPLDFGLRHGPHVKYSCVTALDDEIVVGFACAYPMPEVRQGKFGIYELAVAEQYQQQGLGRRLLRKLLLNLREQGGTEVEVVTLPELSVGAVKLYESAGFRPVAEWAVY